MKNARNTSTPPAGTVDESTAWRVLLAGVAARRAGRPLQSLAADRHGQVLEGVLGDGAALLSRAADGRWQAASGLPDGVARMFALYLPLLDPGCRQPLVLAHLGQSLDGFIATRAGDSHYIGGEQSLAHLHRLRALCDAVLVGATTVASDDPRLTTRLVQGEHPLRVVLDPHRRLPAGHRLFHDGAAPTLVFCAPAHAAPPAPPGVQCIEVPYAQPGGLDLAAVLATLVARGVRVLLVEGGGTTVSRLLAAGLVHRLQLAVAPFFIGDGRPGVRVPASEHLRDCNRPRARSIAMGEDVLFDLDLEA